MDYADESGIPLVFFDPPEIFDSAILGVCIGNGLEPAVLYDLAIVRTNMRRRTRVPLAEIEEHLTVNTLGTSVGPETPRFLVRP